MKKYGINSIWEGVFNNFAETNCKVDIHFDPRWLKKQVTKIQNKLTIVENDNLTSPTAITKDYPLAIVTSMLLVQQNHINIIDFGGGMGEQYLELIAKIPNAIEKINFHIIEHESTIQNLPKKIQTFKKLTFANNLEVKLHSTDILHIGSTLHYLDNWQEILKNLLTIYQPKYLILSDLLAGNIPTFITCQIYYEQRMPVRMFNLIEICDYLQSFKFKKIYQALYEVELLGSKTLLANALPQKYRLSNTVNLIFYNTNNDNK